MDFFTNLPSKPLTLDLMETMDLIFFFSDRACYYQNAPNRKMNEIKVVDKLSICKVGSVLIFGTKFTQSSYGSCKKWSKVSMRSKV